MFPPRRDYQHIHPNRVAPSQLFPLSSTQISERAPTPSTDHHPGFITSRRKRPSRLFSTLSERLNSVYTVCRARSRWSWTGSPDSTSRHLGSSQATGQRRDPGMLFCLGHKTPCLQVWRGKPLHAQLDAADQKGSMEKVAGPPWRVGRWLGGIQPRESDGHWSVLVVVGSREGIVEKE